MRSTTPMQPDTTQARYELLTRHALAVAGVVASEIYFLDPPHRRPRLVAASYAHPGPHPSWPTAEVPILDWPGAHALVRAVLNAPGLHRKAGAHRPAVDQHERDLEVGELNFLGARIEAGNELRGL